MIEYKEGSCSMEGTLKEILVGTVAVLATTHKIRKKELGEEKANVVFAALGKTAVELNEIKAKFDLL